MLLVAAAAVAAGVAAGAKGGEWIDAVWIARSATRTFGGSWKVQKGAIAGEAIRGGRLEIPLEVTGSYELAASVARVSGKGPYGLRFPVGVRSLALTLAANDGKEDLLGGTWRSKGMGKTSTTPSVLEPGKPCELRIAVRRQRHLAKVTVTANGRDHLSWQGDTRTICPEELWGHTSAKTLSLGLWNGSVRSGALKLRVIDGKHRVIRKRPTPKLARFDPQKLPRGQGVGRTEGTPFREAMEKGGLLVGFSFRYSTKGGLVTLIPIFKTKDGIVHGRTYGARQYPDEAVQTLLARDGFGVGGVIATRGTERPIGAIKVVFMKARNGKLDPTRSYESTAYGARSGGRPVLLGGDGRAVVGIEGRAGSTLEQLSLVLR
jgi:hypothetical protein